MSIRRILGRYLEAFLSLIKYLISFVMIVEGVETILLPPVNTHDSLGWLYASKTTLVILGTVFLMAGIVLFAGKFMRSRKWTGHGILAAYLCFLFASIIQFSAYPASVMEWLPNVIMTIVMGALWLRWKYQTTYINPKHFQQRTFHLRD